MQIGDVQRRDRYKKLDNIEMLIEWLVPIKAADLQKLRLSNLASIRLRTAVAASAAMQSGAKNQFTDGFEAPLPDVVVVGKIDNISDPTRATRWVNRLARVRAESKASIVVDYTDHHLIRHNELSKFYANALLLATHAVCSSRLLKRCLIEFYSGPITLIDDPIEVPIIKPFRKSNSLPTAMWFGHASNLPYLIKFLREDYRHQDKARLVLMTNLYPLPTEIRKLLDGKNIENLEINVLKWSLDDMIKASSIADVCWIPTGTNDPRKSGASSNRLLTALSLGLPTAAGRLDSYADLKDYFVDIDSKEVYRQLHNPSKYYSLTETAQDLIKKDNSIEAIGTKWLDFFNNVVEVVTA